MSNDTNPETGVADMESAVKSLLITPEGQDDREEAEAAPEPHDDPEAVEAADDADEATEPDAEAEGESDEGEEETSDDPMYTITVDGEEYEVNLSELRNGYQRQSDYTRKTSQLAEERRALQAKTAEVEQLRNQLEAAMAKYAQGDGEPEPDWEKLSEDPWEYSKARVAWDKKQAERGEARRRLEAVQQQRTQAKVAEEMGKLVNAFPEWQTNGAFDRAKMEAGREDLRKTARAYGFSDEEFFSAIDHRAFLLLRDAAVGRKMAAASKKPPVEKKVTAAPPKALKPGAKALPAEQAAKNQEALRTKLRRKGDTETAVEWLLSGG